MKLILAYIPKPLNSNLSNYSQQEYIKKINNIIDDFFKEITPKKHEEIIEINYDKGTPDTYPTEENIAFLIEMMEKMGIKETKNE